MRLLCIHQNFPGQFRYLIPFMLKQPGVQLVCLGRDSAPGLPNMKMLRYKLPATNPQTHPYLKTMESAVLHGQQTLKSMLKLKEAGFVPDIILAHPGWGETLYAKEAFPQAKLVHFSEFYYHTHGADVNFDPEFPLSIDGAARLRTRNALHLLNLEQCDLAVTPTHWQHQVHPEVYKDKMQVIHEGIPWANLLPTDICSVTLPGGKTIYQGDPVVTFVSRNLEPYRGFHMFMRILPELLAQNSQVQIVVVGADGVSYGKPPSEGMSWREYLLKDMTIDTSRVHFLGAIPYQDYVNLLQVSSVHLYWTYPFVLSWSLMEALALGCRVIASDTPPVTEMIESKINGDLVNFFDQSHWVTKILEALAQPNPLQRKVARESMRKYDTDVGCHQYFDLLKSL